MDSAPKLNGGGRSSKQGGAATNSRNSSFPPPSGHHSVGGSSSLNTPRGKAAMAAATPPSAEETFSLVSGGNSPTFSMIIKLTPSLVEEIKRAEAEGGKTRLKFDSNPYNSSGNIIEVGGNEFRFIWSREFGDLCDIYEERKSGEDGNGLLVESGCAWRKLSVQRVLDESTKNHVKMRSEEAERNLKSRRAIVLEPGNQSMNSQMKALAAVEGSSATKNYSKRKEAARRKRNVKNFQGGGPPKSTYKPRSSSENATEGRHSSSFSFLPTQPTASASPLEAVTISKSIDDALPSQLIGKRDSDAKYEKGIPFLAFNAMRDTSRSQGKNIAKPTDLQSMLISLLKNKPNGLTIKALVKAVQDIVPNPLREIKLILRNIARYKSPGRYILLPGVDFESLNKPQNESGSSAIDNHGQKPAHQQFCDRSVSLGRSKEKVPIFYLEKRVLSNSNVEEESSASEKINVQHASPYIFGGEKGSDHSKGEGGGTSDGESGSVSESHGGDSGHDTGGHSARTGSGSSSDSESDASVNSKEGLDEDVDIMISDEEKESKHQTEASYQNVPSTIPVRSPGMGVQVHESTPSHNSIGLESLDKSPAIDQRGTHLRRDLLDLELGKPVKSAPEETQLAKQFERRITFTPAENRASTSSEKGKLKADNAEMEFLSMMSPRNFEFRETGKLKPVNAETEFLNTLSERNYRSSANEFGMSQGIELELSSENSTRVDRGKDPKAADKNNCDQKGESSSDETHYLKYEKDEPVLKGRIWTHSQYKDYVREYNGKYKDYSSLNNNLTTYRNEFQQLCNQIEDAKRSRDLAAYNYYLGRIKESYEHRGVMHKRLKKVFVVLHKELEHLRQMIDDYVNSQKKK